MKRTTLSTALYVLLVFVSGGVVGAFAHRLYMLNTVVASPKPDEWLVKYRAEMHSRLSLSNEQMTQLESILELTRSRFKDLRTRTDKEAREKSRPEMKIIQEDQVRKINEILSEPQRAEYQKLRDERAARRQKNNNSKPALPPGD